MILILFISRYIHIFFHTKRFFIQKYSSHSNIFFIQKIFFFIHSENKNHKKFDDWAITRTNERTKRLTVKNFEKKKKNLRLKKKIFFWGDNKKKKNL
ncbi:hypothetical protein RhiirC2_46440 [Rhizophagus irregularis]|uniref:Uncharacterized protein n=1 Tax=Rhizophagus irregularis TaxID=588596 RepID=A0A2N1NV25_9GLOM|nr:hypothetical protein RhiirC2_46440 [Rhizophagus irregularis]